MKIEFLEERLGTLNTVPPNKIGASIVPFIDFIKNETSRVNSYHVSPVKVKQMKVTSNPS